MAVIVNVVYLFANAVFWYKNKTHTNTQSEKLYIISNK